jgi:hypothetical protein
MRHDERHSRGEFAIIAVPTAPGTGTFEDSSKDTRLVGIEVVSGYDLIVKKKFHFFNE